MCLFIMVMNIVDSIKHNNATIWYYYLCTMCAVYDVILKCNFYGTIIAIICLVDVYFKTPNSLVEYCFFFSTHNLYKIVISY